MGSASALTRPRPTPDGVSPITAGDDAAARVWRIVGPEVEGKGSFAATETAEIRGHGEAITHAELLSDTRLVTGARDGSIRLTDLDDARLLGFVPAMLRNLLPRPAPAKANGLQGP